MRKSFLYSKSVSHISKKGVSDMATSTFDKQFVVKPEKASDFVREMTKPASPTLRSSFSSHLSHEKDMKSKLLKVLK